ncbi:MAG: dehypoxanthine futalosine cyclase [Desulfobacterium sp.]|nr:dehypoxanthine futalosine cyclase [Desulfobacterium sp.]
MKSLDALYSKINNSERINSEEALDLLIHGELLDLADAANQMRKRLHPEPIVTYVVDRNINYTNVCSSGCLFCAFYRDSENPKGYVISEESLKQKIQETLSLGGTQILLQGGLHPGLDLDYYLSLLRFIKNNFPIHIHGFSPPEILFMAEQSGLSVTDTLKKLIQAGLGSIPGGGAEILVDEVRMQLSPKKYRSEQWLDVMRKAHQLNLRTTATMMFGHIETREQIIQHLMKIRDLQDETGGFTAFIPWTFQSDHTRLNVKKATAVEYLRVLSVSRLFLDNIDNIQASWVTQGDKIAQASLSFGANDLGSTMIEENVVAAAGVSFRLPKEEMIRLIKNAGYQPRQRDCFYNLIEGK